EAVPVAPAAANPLDLLDLLLRLDLFGLLGLLGLAVFKISDRAGRSGGRRVFRSEAAPVGPAAANPRDLLDLLLRLDLFGLLDLLGLAVSKMSDARRFAGANLDAPLDAGRTLRPLVVRGGGVVARLFRPLDALG